MVRHQQQVGEIVAQDPNIFAFSSQVGFGGGSQGTNQGSMNVELKPRSERALSVDQVIDSLRPKIAQMPGIRASMVNPPVINISARQTRALYQFTLQDTDTEELYRWAPIFEEKMKELPGLQDVNTDLLVNNPQVSIDLNRDRISALGLTVNQVQTAMFNAYGTRQISQIYAPDNQYQVLLGVAPEFQRDPSALSQLYVRSSTGRLVALSSVTTATMQAGPQTVSHTGQLPSVTISFNLEPGVPLGDAVAAIQQLAANTLPSAISTSFQGTAQAFQDSLQGLGLILLMAIVVIYLVLGILYESFTHPLTILSGLPVRGLRRVADAAHLQHGAEPLCVRRRHHARRAGEEERHHDGGLRHRRAGARQGAARSDPRSLPRPLPADHDDDDGRARRHAADRRRPGRRRRVTPPAGDGGRRRTARLAVADALHHPGVLTCTSSVRG